ncbi:MAG: hypothetical protein J6S14_23015 [Clostridia bacterium]|nr:hypothetical protein [Clostridia bacterium]
MAYKITRNRIVEELEIEDNGKTLLLNVDINVDSILHNYNIAQVAMHTAAQEAKAAANNKDLQKAEEKMGEAVLSLFEIIFGEEQTKQIIEFYDNRVTEMLGDVAPFINDVVTPKIQEAQQRIQERYKQVNRGRGFRR